jgi:uncharacterized protein DUF1858
MSLTINPQTKLGSVLDAYPGIDDKLISWVPAFSKLKNPVLRKTVEKLATLEQAAKIGGVSVRDLVVKLREETGQNPLDVVEDAPPATAPEATDLPAWLNRDQIKNTIDADAMLATGVHPLGTVKQSVVALQAGEIVELTSGFRPDPLLEAMQASGLAVFSHEESPGRHHSYFCRPSDDPEIASRVQSHSCNSGSGCG